jgi:hypothetical protein
MAPELGAGVVGHARLPQHQNANTRTHTYTHAIHAVGCGLGRLQNGPAFSTSKGCSMLSKDAAMAVGGRATRTRSPTLPRTSTANRKK